MENEAIKTGSPSNKLFLYSFAIIIASVLIFSFIEMEKSKRKNATDAAALQAKVTQLQYKHIALPDSAGKYLIIFNKAILSDVHTEKAHLEKNHVARLMSRKDKIGELEFINVQSDNGEYFSFILNAEQMARPFQLQIMENGTWSSIKTNR